VEDHTCMPETGVQESTVFDTIRLVTHSRAVRGQVIVCKLLSSVSFIEVVVMAQVVNLWNRRLT